LGRADFDVLGSRAAARRPFAMIVSALAFGALHRSFLAGTLAGAIYGLALLPRGRLADAVIAHAVTNGLLFGWAVLGGDWRWVL
jgi:membrane protease YdiL (CAAX protease family)